MYKENRRSKVVSKSKFKSDINIKKVEGIRVGYLYWFMKVRKWNV